MSVSIKIHRKLQEFADGNAVLTAEGSTVGEALNEVFLVYPGLREKLLDGSGKLKPRFEIFVNRQSVYPKVLERAIRDGDEIYIAMMIAGG